jgi:hypothetical protein
MMMSPSTNNNNNNNNHSFSTTTPSSRKKNNLTAISTPDTEACCFASDSPDSSSSPKQQQQHPLAFSIVWSPLPPITWVLPFVGHTGICDSQGIASDFRGPYYVGDDGRMAFGPPTRALSINIVAQQNNNNDGIDPERWDAAIRLANEEYRTRMHNICCDNCHSHVAYALNAMHVTDHRISHWNMVKIATVVFFKAQFLSWTAVIQQFLPFAIILTLIIYFGR